MKVQLEQYNIVPGIAEVTRSITNVNTHLYLLCLFEYRMQFVFFSFFSISIINKLFLSWLWNCFAKQMLGTIIVVCEFIITSIYIYTHIVVGQFVNKYFKLSIIHIVHRPNEIMMMMMIIK